MLVEQPKRGRLRLDDESHIRLRPSWPNHVWAYDFVMVRTHDGGAFRMLTIIDEYPRRHKPSCLNGLIRPALWMGSSRISPFQSPCQD